MTEQPSMSVSRNGGSRPVPDPTELTDRAIARLEKSLTEYIDGQLSVRDERLKGIDEATRLRLGGMDAIPVQIEAAVGRLRDLVLEKFTGVSKSFSERDTRSENEKRDSKVAVDAAFAAQKEAAAKQDEGNAKAIDKSEKATAETIKTNQELSRAVTDGLTKDVDSLKLAVNAIQSAKIGAVETRIDSRQSMSVSSGLIFGGIGAIVGLAGLIALILSALRPPGA